MKRFAKIIMMVVTMIMVVTQGAAMADQVHRVSSGETLSIIAGRYEASAEDIARKNYLQNPNRIFSGQVLIIPAVEKPGIYRVQPGDSLYNISVNLGVSMNELIRMNNIQNPNHLSIGQVLNVPKGTSPSQPSSPAPNPTNTYTVKSGDSLHRISQQYGVTVDALVSANKLQNRDFIYVGQILTIPATPVRQPEASFNHTVSQLAAMFPSTFYLKGSGNSKRIALTFDDGPDTHYTPQVLDVLKKYNVPATFYLMGSRAEGNPGIVRRIISEGHVIGNHTWSHPDLGNVSQSRVITEIQRTEDALFNITGLRTATMRPPYGAVNKDVLDQLKTMNYRVINWSVDSKDWRDRSVDQILINTLPDVREEAILLFHSAGGEGQSLKATVDALPELIETLRMQGYTFTTVDKLLGIPAYK